MVNQNVLLPTPNALVHSTTLPLATPVDQVIETGARILIVDSQEINRRTLRAMLKSASHQIRECRRASEAMQILLSEQIDLVVLDLVLPEVSGLELCRWLKA